MVYWKRQKNNYMSLSEKKILLTGASGFIGSALGRRLVSEHSIVHGVSRNQQSANGGIKWWVGDLTDYEFVEMLFRSVQPDIVFHLASYVSGSRDINIVLPAYHAIVTTTVNMLHAATLNNCERVILAGSMEEPRSETSDIIPGSPYAAAKLSCTHYARMYHALYGTPVIIPKIFMAYGPDQKDEKKIIPYVINSLLQGERPKLSSGVRSVDWIYIEDVVDGLIKMTGLDGYYGKHIDLGTGRLVTIKEVVTTIANLMGCTDLIEFGDLGDRPLETMNMADTDRTSKILDWMPNTDLREGLIKTIAWYKERYLNKKNPR
jgi:UDP-glucose 4-epimerase